MALKQGQETHSSYIDGIKVKISEKYKPPPRINLAMTYSQRLTLNKQVLDNIRNYNFILEETAKSNLNDWKNTRKVLMEGRISRFKKYKLEKEENWLKNQESNCNNMETQDSRKIDNTIDAQLSRSSKPSNSSHKYNAFTLNSDVLVPTQVPSFVSILTPTPMTTNPRNDSYSFNNVDPKSPFNISEFEADTSSPFDNVELKTINDMEELAKVLRNSGNSHRSMHNYSVPSSSIFEHCQDLTSIPGNHKLLHNIQNVICTDAKDIPAAYHYTSNPLIPEESHSKKDVYTPIPKQNENSSPESTFKPIPDILKCLETGLQTIHIAKVPTTTVIKDSHSELKPTHTANDKTPNTETDDDTFQNLSFEMKSLSRSISSMGFPLDRVARACKAIGNDYKKIVDHLIVMSELLDLGFSEQQVSPVLLQCNNDRDKALDILIS